MSKQKVQQAVANYVANTSQPTGYELTDDLFNALPDAIEPQIIEVEKIVEVRVEVAPEGAIVPRTDGSMQIGRFVMTPTELVIPQDVSEDEWHSVGKVISQLESAVSWHVGDWAKHANNVWGVSYEQMAEWFGYEVETLWTYAWVASSVSTSIRNRGVSFSHHRLVAKMDEDKQHYWLKMATSKSWTITQMRQALSQKPPALSAGSALADKNNRKILNRVWAGVEQGRGVKPEDIAHLRRWLDEVERSFGAH